MEKLLKQLETFTPGCEQEERDRLIMTDWIRTRPDAFLRTDQVAHLTASAWIVNRDRTKVLMAWHNIYRSWSWTGGHADGETDLLAVALREAEEETGVKNVRPVSEDIFSLETLVVEGHEKHGVFVPCHLHMNVTYLLEADESGTLTVRPDENSAVGWIPVEELPARVTEPWMMTRIYGKLVERVRKTAEHSEWVKG